MRSSIETAVPASDSAALPVAVRRAISELVRRGFDPVGISPVEIFPGHYVLGVKHAGFSTSYDVDDLIYGEAV